MLTIETSLSPLKVDITIKTLFETMNWILKIPLIILSAVWELAVMVVQIIATMILSAVLYVLFYALFVATIFWILTH